MFKFFRLLLNLIILCILCLNLSCSNKEEVTESSNENLDGFVIGQARIGSFFELSKSLELPSSVLSIGSKLVVAVRINSRILIYNQVPTTNYAAADLVLGQSNLTSQKTHPLAKGLNLQGVWSVTGSSNKLIATSYDDNRVFIWNSFPASNNQLPDVVLGQPNTNEVSENNGGVSASSLYRPTGTSLCGTKLFVADSLNNRVLVWNTIPTSNQQAADLVLGQTNFSNNGIRTRGKNTVQNPWGIYCDGTRLFVSDVSNHRVLIWNSLPTTDDQPADVVLGQSFGTTNNFGSTAILMNSPYAVYTDGSKLFVSDSNKRILIWNTIPTVDAQPADLVLGQPNFTAPNQKVPVSNKTVNTVREFTVSSGKLIAADSGNHRVLIWNSIPTTNEVSADIVIGQSSFTSDIIGEHEPISSSTSFSSNDIASNGKNLLSLDTSANRLLIWDKVREVNNLQASIVLGQANLNSSSTHFNGITAQSFNRPQGVATNGSLIYVSDTQNNRILGWRTRPTSNSQAADFVLGQPSFNQDTANNGGLSAANFFRPWDIDVCGNKLIVSDFNNNRVLIWNSLPTTDNVAADVVIGQPDKVSRIVNNGGLSSSSLRFPTKVACNSNGNLIISDYLNYRLLFFNSIPTIDGASADFVIGQPDFVTNAKDVLPIKANRIDLTKGLEMTNDRIYLMDNGYRVLVWDSLPSTNDPAANFVLGQSGFDSFELYSRGFGINNFINGAAIYQHNNHLFIGDNGNKRVLGIRLRRLERFFSK